MYVLELGGEHDAFARREAATAASGVERLASGLATANAVAPMRVRTLAFTRHAIALVGITDASVASARTLLETAPFDRDGSIAVRARDVRGGTGISTTDVERELGQVLVDHGLDVDLDDPDHVLHAVFAPDDDDPESHPVDDPSTHSDGDGTTNPQTGADGASGQRRGDAGTCALGWRVASSMRDYGQRKPTDRPFFQPGSMDPLLARAVANLAGARPGATILDPMCGTGGVLIEAGLVGADVYGVDAQAKMATGARENLAAFLDPPAGEDALPGTPTNGDGPSPGAWATCRGDATHLPFHDDAVDGVAFDAPYGRQSKIETHGLDDLVAGALAESRRVADRCVLVADRSWTTPARDAGWTIDAAFTRRVHASLDRHVLVLDA